MPNAITTMEEANLFCGATAIDSAASNHLTLTELKLPGMDEQYVDHRAAGGSLAIEINTIFARLESTFMLIGWTPQVQELVDSWVAQQNSFTAYGVIRNKLDGTASRAIALMTGRLGRADPQNWRRGDIQHWQYSIRGIIHYELWLDQENIYYWDFFNNQFIVGGVDRMADVNPILGIVGGGGAAVTITPPTIPTIP